MAIERRQSAVDDAGGTANAMFDSQPLEGSLLVAVLFNRGDLGNDPSPTFPSGWTVRIARKTEIANSAARRALAVATRVAGIDESMTVTGNWNAQAVNNNQLHIHEFTGGDFTVFVDAGSNDNGATADGQTISTGTADSGIATDVFMFGALGGRIGTGNHLQGTSSWTNGLEDDVDAAGGPNDRLTSLAWAVDTTAGIKSSTATTSPSENTNTGLSAGIVLFDVSGAAPEPTPDPAAESMPMGSQRIDTLVANLRDLSATDGGLLTEHEGGFRYRVRADLYNQEDALTVRPQPHMPTAPRPTRDNQRIRNDITASSPLVTSTRATDEASIAKRGSLEETITVNPKTAGQLQRIAFWRLHLGTSPGMRWPRLPLRLSPSNPDLIMSWLGVKVGDRIAVDHEFTQIPGVDIDLLVEGWSEVWDAIQWDVTLNCVPALPYTVAVFDSSRFGTVGSETSGSFVAGTDTSLTVVTTANQSWINSTDHALEFPFQIRLSGVVLNVTAISGATSPQTFTVDQAPVNGIEKTIPDGSPVQLAPRPVFAL